jgi:hypothetical protein
MVAGALRGEAVMRYLRKATRNSCQQPSPIHEAGKEQRRKSSSDN